MDDIERAAIAAEGYDPDDLAVVAALARVTAVLAELGRSKFGTRAGNGPCTEVSSRRADWSVQNPTVPVVSFWLQLKPVDTGRGSLVSDDAASDKRLELAYDAGQKKLAMQDTTLGNVRTRANTLLATAALFTSFSAGTGLLNTDPNKGAVLSPCAGAGLLILMVLLGACVLYVAWPAKDWAFVPSASIIMQKYRAGETEDAIRTFVTDAMVEGGKKNQPKLGRRQNAFRAAVVLLVAEVALLIWLLIVR